MTISLSMLAANAQLNALAKLLDDGYIRMYTGNRPASTDIEVQDQTIVSELRFGQPAFFKAENGLLRAKPIKADPSAANGGHITWYRTFMSDGKTAVIDGSVGTKEADLIVNFVDIQKTASFSLHEYRLRNRNVIG